MQICLIMDKPETRTHPVIVAAMQRLSARHTVRWLDVRGLTGAQAIAREETQPRADLYLLKSHVAQALELAHSLEQKGASVVNSWESTLACLDRVLTAQCMHEAGLPWPASWSFPSLENLLTRYDLLSTLPLPLIIKSYYSREGDLVEKVQSVEQLQALLPRWSQEPIVLQEFAVGDGWDIKMWVIDKQIFAARRRTPLEAGASREDFPIPTAELPTEWAHIALEIGRVFHLLFYGVDLLVTQKGPMIVDVNAFPGFRGVPGADSALADLVERIGKTRKGEP